MALKERIFIKLKRRKRKTTTQKETERRVLQKKDTSKCSYSLTIIFARIKDAYVSPHSTVEGNYQLYQAAV
jgi:hypothetical protein